MLRNIRHNYLFIKLHILYLRFLQLSLQYIYKDSFVYQ